MSVILDGGGFEPIHWPDEADAVIYDIKKHVQQIVISTLLPATDQDIYLNCETKEAKRSTIRLSAVGFEVVGHEFDTNNINAAIAYETPYALLNAISPAFVQSFANGLTEALLNFQSLSAEYAD